MNRRHVLLSLGTLAVAGCVGRNSDSDDDDTESNPTDLDSKLESMDDIAYERRQVDRTNDRPEWAELEDVPAGDAALYDSAETALDTVPDDDLDASNDDLESFVEETDFDRSRLLSVVAVGRGNTELQVGIEQLGVYNGELVGELTAENAQPGDSIDTFAWAFVRATVEEGESPPDEATVRIDSVGDRETTVEMTTA